MGRYWFAGIALVSGVAALKTGLIVAFVLEPASADWATVTGLFAFFFALTSAVAYLCILQIRKYQGEQRKMRLAPGGGEPVAKESVIARYAPDWGLSQAEADVAMFVAKGFSNSEVAEMRGCAIATVKSQLSSIYQKSGLGSRYQLIAFVTDEVCASANIAETEKETRATSVPTRRVLPLVGRSKFSDPERLRA